jgi:hypothetical protein
VSAPVVHRFKRGYGTGGRVHGGRFRDPSSDEIGDLTPGQLLEVYLDAAVSCDEPTRPPWYRWGSRPAGEQHAWFDVDIMGAERVTPQIADWNHPIDWTDPLAFRRRELFQAAAPNALISARLDAGCGPRVIIASWQISVIVWPL